MSQPTSTSRRHANKCQQNLQQSFHSPNTFLQLPPSQNLVIDFSTTARDLKGSFQGFTVLQPMLKTVAQTSQQRYLPNQNLTIYPTFPNPPPNSYITAILKYCDKTAQDNSEKMAIPYTDPKTHRKAMSTDFSNVYYHFYQACLSRHNALFTPQLLILPPDIKPFLPTEICCICNHVT